MINEIEDFQQEFNLSELSDEELAIDEEFEVDYRWIDQSTLEEEEVDSDFNSDNWDDYESENLKIDRLNNDLKQTLFNHRDF